MKRFLLLAAAVISFSPAPVQSQTLNPIWNIPATGVRSYITNDANARGLAYNPITDHVIIVSRTGGLSVNAVDAATGAQVSTLNTTGIAGGFFALSMIGVGDDGAIYGANMITTSLTNNFKIYRWANEGATPTVAFDGIASGANNQRYGDTLAVRGTGAGTQILASSRFGSNAVLFTTTDGISFSPTSINTGTNLGGLGLAFGAGDTFWAKGNSGTALMQLDLNTGALLNHYSTAAFTNTFSPIGLDLANNLLGAVSISTPDRFILYDISSSISSSNPPVLLDIEPFTSDNLNNNAVGSVDFGPGRVFALDTANGIVAFDIVPVPEPGTLALGVLTLGALLGARRLRRRS